MQIHYFLCQSSSFPLVAHIVTMPINKCDVGLIPALGQREEVSSIAKRINAVIAINGSNYRRGGKFNGSRLNLFYFDRQIYSDLQFMRGSFGWDSRKKVATIDKMFLSVSLFIDQYPCKVDQINQPRLAGQSVIYTGVADKFLLQHTAGKNIVVDSSGIVQDITFAGPETIPSNWFIYQVDKDSLPNVHKGMRADFLCKVKSAENNKIYNGCDFIIGGAGMLLQNGTVVSEQLYDEFSQGIEVVHCHDEVAADFHTRKMQEWLIEQRHPRTAIGITTKNEICIVVVDGRQSGSEGLSLHELAELMKSFDCVSALNIGGGGCSTLCINKKIINSPSAGEERPVSEAICFFQ